MAVSYPCCTSRVPKGQATAAWGGSDCDPPLPLGGVRRRYNLVFKIAVFHIVHIVLAIKYAECRRLRIAIQSEFRASRPFANRDAAL